MDKITETKEEILEALKDKKALCCPYCDHSVFIRKTYSKVELIDYGETIKDEEVKSLGDETIYICAKCDEEVTEKELIRE